jgi:Holliday junction resolvasome RuvABC endonuclease subunit
MMALGIDPPHGYAILSTLPGAVFSWYAIGELRAEHRVEDLAELLVEARPDLVAIEDPRGYAYNPVRVKNLLETKGVAATLAQAARERGFRVFEAPAPEWRKAICGNATASDRAIKTAVRLRVRGWPGRTTTHERDGAGVAMYALLRRGLRLVR